MAPQSTQLWRLAASNLQEIIAVFQLCLGNSAPFLALVGVSLASGSGLITKEDELECVCREVRLFCCLITPLTAVNFAQQVAQQVTQQVAQQLE